mgnify:CR=1 FL=1
MHDLPRMHDLPAECLADRLVALYTERPLDFSVFPSLLLIVTLLRLGLNVASTRLILLGGAEGTHAAGKIIEAFGAVVVGGNYAVGFVVFVILVVINFVVITKGDIVSQAEREVFASRVSAVNPKAAVLHVNGLTGQGAFELSTLFDEEERHGDAHG